MWPYNVKYYTFDIIQKNWTLAKNTLKLLQKFLATFSCQEIFSSSVRSCLTWTQSKVSFVACCETFVGGILFFSKRKFASFFKGILKATTCYNLTFEWKKTLLFYLTTNKNLHFSKQLDSFARVTRHIGSFWKNLAHFSGNFRELKKREEGQKMVLKGDAKVLALVQ